VNVRFSVVLLDVVFNFVCSLIIVVFRHYIYNLQYYTDDLDTDLI